MASVKQLEANQRNAARSTGPKTPEGKEKVRFNAVKHGLRAEVLEILPQEDPIEFDRRLDAWFDDYAPRTESEAFLVRRAAVLAWKIDRADCCEIALMSDRVQDIIKSFVDNPLRELESVNNEFLKTAWGASFPFGNDGEQLRRYQVTLHRMLLKTLDALAKLRARAEKRNPKETIGANEAALEEVRQECRPHTSESPARRGSPAPAETADCGSPVVGQGVDAPRSPAPWAPNEANSAAPNKAISSRGARELERFVAGTDRRHAQNAPMLDISIEKR